MRKILFGAQVEIHNLAPNNYKTAQKIRSKTNSLRQDYAQFSDSDLRIDIHGNVVRWLDEFSGRRTGECSPTIDAIIQVREGKKNRILRDQVTRKVGEVFDEPLWKFFWRVRRETNKLIRAAGVQPNQK